MSHYAPNETNPHGPPDHLAKWAHAALLRMAYGKHYALVMTGSDSAELVVVDSGKYMQIESRRPDDIVGIYTGCQNRKARVAVEDLEMDIRATLYGAAA